MRRTATNPEAAAASLDICRGLARYLIVTTGAPTRTATRAEVEELDAEDLRRLARQQDGHPLAAQIVARLDNAEALS